MATLRDDGYHVGVTRATVEKSVRLIESVLAEASQLRFPVTYEVDINGGRAFRCGTRAVGAFDLWGNLVIYHEAL